MDDITTKEDIKFLVNHFYEKLLKDETIGFIFKDHMSMNLEDHLPIMYQFWESAILGIPSYRGNPMVKHIELNRKIALKENHFDVWIKQWEETIDRYFQGDKADEAKKKAIAMKEIMLLKIQMSNKKGFIQ